ncbi:precorrin-2 C(20)-methyltransferase [Prosthecochloris sp. GSB1]|uniref:precorrin-2 C(20)-methyltransferase n=1 Tax=Prosthecochloris sp. GSB1 TaxID=281093 RepID=UPI001F355C8C|nr:precorrin-2 C(20)-methyltransferase [Prosthecochloris sp. GSB1]
MKKTGLETGHLYAVSLGPGDPGLITLRALRVLEDADSVWYPATFPSSGEPASIALDILRSCGIDDCKCRCIEMPMSRDRRPAENVYALGWSRILDELLKKNAVAVVTVGDAGIYSTVSPFLERASEAGVPYSVVAGVPAFLAAGAAAGIPLVRQADRLTVLARVRSVDEIERSLGEDGTVVVMKLSTLRDQLLPWLESCAAGFVYAEKIGMQGEFITSDVEKLRSRKIPYFSLLICSRNGRNA